MSRTQLTPQLDAPLGSFSLVSADDGRDVALDELTARGPAVLALLHKASPQDARAAMLRELGERTRSSAATLYVVTEGDSELGKQLAAVRVARWLTDPSGDARRSLGLIEGKRLRKKQRDGLFVIDGEHILRMAFVAHSPGQWIPASFVFSRLARLGVPAPDAAGDAEPSLPRAEDESIDSAVCATTQALGQALGLDGTDLTQLGTACRFRDLGMTAVPDEIITKPGPLNDEEWAVVRTHPERSAELLGPSPLFAQVRGIVRATHENWDGSGYPDGVAGEDIPLGARIILVSEAYVALCSKFPDADPMQELREGAGTSYDPRVVAALETLVAADQQQALQG
jgi:HD domain-containing protein